MEYSQKGMIFIEDPDFEKRRRGLLNDDELFELMKWLAINPGAGKVIPGSGGAAQNALGCEKSWQTGRSARHLLLVGC